MPKGIVGWLIFAAFVVTVYLVWQNYVKTRIK